MRLFTCPNCNQVLYFENTLCERCGHAIAYCPPAFTMLDTPPDETVWRSKQGEWRLCANAEHGVCNWLVQQDSESAFCAACAHTNTVPDLSVSDNLAPWRQLEIAKHRLFYAIMRFGLPHPTRQEDPEHGLAFDLLADLPSGPKVMTGHDNGLITIALKEGENAVRERMREEMGELYRTPLGHFRHEVGHYYWDVLVRDSGELEGFRALFGDERQDYDEALKAHYARRDTGAWRESYVSLYASSHPWEDFAETWAHYLHIVDTLEMASAFGIRVAPKVAHDPSLETDVGFDPYRADSIEMLLDAWLPLCFAVNSLNRAMGQPDLYPFVISPTVAEKLDFVRRLIREKAEPAPKRVLATAG